MTSNGNSIMEGGCTCRQLRYRLSGTPLIVHACHCRWCQRETGTAFATNALYEADRVTHLAGEPDVVVTPSASGKEQPWLALPTGAKAVPEFYDLATTWSVESLERRRIMREKAKAQRI